ncbi:MAG TPA: hypothetical protein VEO74_12625 [Thermoanaerobaculia bacterium]|nr:hypothetical protein [Thermoanaerobaculia bacterium]
MPRKLVCLFLLFGASSAVAATSLFPRSLHLVRKVQDPFAKTPRVVDQYCYGNVIVAVAGQRVTITDYAAQQVTEIDHAHATYSVTRFDEIARASAPPRRPARPATAAASANAKPAETWRTTPLGMRHSASGRSVDSFEIGNGAMKIEVGFDRSYALSRDAVEALVGASYPNVRRQEHDEMLRAAAVQSVARSGASAEPAYGLPSEKAITYQTEGGAVTVRDSIVRVDGDLPPRDALLVEPGAKRVDSRLVRLEREMHDADTIPIPHP